MKQLTDNVRIEVLKDSIRVEIEDIEFQIVVCEDEEDCVNMYDNYGYDEYAIPKNEIAAYLLDEFYDLERKTAREIQKIAIQKLF